VSQWAVIARREFLERVRTKWFVIVTLLGPLGLVGIVVIPAYLGKKSAEKPVVVQVVDESDRAVGEAVVAASAALGSKYKIEAVAGQVGEDELWRRVKAEEIDGFLRIPAGIIDGGEALYRGDNAASFSVRAELTKLVNFAVVGIRAQDAGLDEANVLRVLRPVSVSMEGSAGASGAGLFIAGYVVMFLLYMAILLYAMNVMRGVIQEKTSRVVEIIISAARPRALMLGKIIGVGSVGLAQLTLWAVLALVLINYRGPVLETFGIEGASSLSLPALGALDFAVVLAYFLLGFFLYAALYAAIGALVSSEQEASQLQMPVVLLLIIPVMSVGALTDDPNGPIASALTQFPFSSPVLMPMRYLLDGASLAEVGVSLAILAATIAGVVWVAAKIYRLGILLTGKRPGLREILRWLRHD
jgi:ABC-2 type transport system permease protein